MVTKSLWDVVYVLHALVLSVGMILAYISFAFVLWYLYEEIKLKRYKRSQPGEYTLDQYVQGVTYFDDTHLDQKVHGRLYKKKNGEIIPSAEYIVFRVHDAALIDTLKSYYSFCSGLGCDAGQMLGIRTLLARVEAWQQANPTRVKRADAGTEIKQREKDPYIERLNLTSLLTKVDFILGQTTQAHNEIVATSKFVHKIENAVLALIKPKDNNDKDESVP